MRNYIRPLILAFLLSSCVVLVRLDGTGPYLGGPGDLLRPPRHDVEGARHQFDGGQRRLGEADQGHDHLGADLQHGGVSRDCKRMSLYIPRIFL